MKTHIEVYQSGKEFGWRMKRKGRICADGAERYKRLPTLLRVLRNIVAGGFVLDETVKR